MLSRRTLIKSIGASSAVFSFASPLLLASQDVKSNTNKPNILFIMSDDHTRQAISAYGSVVNRTPNIDRIANEGAIFLRNYCGNSICGPSRATILTGKHSHMHGFKSNHVPSFDSSQPTFPKMLQKAGYQTAIIGKWHLESTPTGFDHWDILPGQGFYYNPDFITKNGTRRVTGYNTTITADLSLDWLKEAAAANKPFMLMCNFKAPHRPWMPDLKDLHLFENETIPEPPTLFDDFFGRTSAIHEQKMSISKDMTMAYDLQVRPVDADNQEEMNWEQMSSYYRMNAGQKQIWDEAFKRENDEFKKLNPQGKDLIRWKYQRYMKNYLRCIAAVDQSVGRLLKYLDDSGLAKNTIVIYTGDQGFFLGEHGLFDKRFMYEETFSMPLMIRLPHTIKSGLKITKLTQNIDFAPTILDAAGISIPDDIQGVSLMPLLKEQTHSDWRTSLYYHYYSEPTHNVAPHEGVVTERYKLIHFYQTGEVEFYDRLTDPYEMASRHHDPYYAKQIHELEIELDRLKKQYKVPAQ